MSSSSSPIGKQTPAASAPTSLSNMVAWPAVRGGAKRISQIFYANFERILLGGGGGLNFVLMANSFFFLNSQSEQQIIVRSIHRPDLRVWTTTSVNKCDYHLHANNEIDNYTINHWWKNNNNKKLLFNFPLSSSTSDISYNNRIQSWISIRRID